MRKKQNINSKVPLVFMKKSTRNYEAYIKNNEEMINNKILLPFYLIHILRFYLTRKI